jgi:hypothetical protein
MGQRRRWWLALAAGVLGSLATVTQAEELLSVQTLRGEVVDPALYVKEGRHGSEWIDQMAEAADGGQTLALLEQEQQVLYLVLTDTPGADPNELLYDHVGQQVRLKGHVYERGGLRGIVVMSIEPAESLEAVRSDLAPEE